MAYCENCGTKLSGGTCSNCQEELYIFENQYDDLLKPSKSFMEKVWQQQKEKGKK